MRATRYPLFDEALDERTRFVGLCEAEACWGDDWDYVTPGRIGRRRRSLKKARMRIAHSEPKP